MKIIVYSFGAIALIIALIGTWMLRTAVDNKKKRGRESKANKRLMGKAILLLIVAFSLAAVLDIIWYGNKDGGLFDFL